MNAECYETTNPKHISTWNSFHTDIIDVWRSTDQVLVLSWDTNRYSKY